MLVSNNYFEIKKNILDFSIWRNLSSRKIRRSNQSCYSTENYLNSKCFGCILKIAEINPAKRNVLSHKYLQVQPIERNL